MPQYTHLSFDFWNTLATSNPQYSKLRLQLIKNTWGISDDDAAKAVFNQFKRIMDCFAEQGGVGLSIPLALKGLNALMPARLKEESLSKLQSDLADAFINNPPLIDNAMVDKILQLSQLFSLNILSNTVVVPGSVVRQAIPPALLNSFSAVLFSDECNRSKPDPMFFQEVLSQMAASTGKTISPCDVLHIGDSMKTDSKCTVVGFSFLKVEDPADCLSKLMNLTHPTFKL